MLRAVSFSVFPVGDRNGMPSFPEEGSDVKPKTAAGPVVQFYRDLVKMLIPVLLQTLHHGDPVDAPHPDFLCYVIIFRGNAVDDDGRRPHGLGPFVLAGRNGFFFFHDFLSIYLIRVKVYRRGMAKQIFR
jgi:hypothetical protein